MFYKTLANNNNNEEVIIRMKSDTLEKSLYYRDEGNMNIVVSLFAHENDEKFVIRFKKIPADESKSTFGDHKNELMAFVHFEELLQKYFEHSECFTVVPKIVFLDVDVHALNAFLMRDRPVMRRNKVIGSNYGLLYRDVAFLPREIYKGKTVNGELKESPTICIEIKAKQGYVIDDGDDHEVKKCRFCFLQYLKLKNSKIKHISTYCPIDLFSGQADQMNRAIKSLIDNPQNNMKMFQDGKMIYNEYSADKSGLRGVLQSLFPDTLSLEKQENLFVNLIREILLKDFKNCDSFAEVCGRSFDAENIHRRSCNNKSTSPVSRNCILSSILNAQLLVKKNFAKLEALEGLQKLIDCDSKIQQILQDYKIGSTALDCSIMLTLRKFNGNLDPSVIDKNHYVTIQNSSEIPQHFIVNATIVDLDIKKDSIAHFRKYKKQYNESKLAYFAFMASKKIEEEAQQSFLG